MRKGICKNGHELTAANSLWFDRKVIDADGSVRFVPQRTCLRCRKRYQRAYMAAERRGKGIRPRTCNTCVNGHPRTPENTVLKRQRYRAADGRETTHTIRVCLRCQRVYGRHYAQRVRAAAKGQGR